MNLRCLFYIFGLIIPAANGADSTKWKPFTLVQLPTQVFKTADRSHENTESWIFSLMAQTGTSVKLIPNTMKVTLFRNSEILRTTSYPAEGLKPLTYQPRSRPLLPDGKVSTTPMFWPFALRIRQTEPTKLGVNVALIEVEAVEEGGRRRHHAKVMVPIETYQQKVSLIFPFRGKGIILQGGAANGGHRNRSGQFAIDAFGLDDSWSIIAPGEGKQNSDYRGWDRELVAPADGVVVGVRDDRPDQPVADTSDPKYYAPEYKDGGDPGNYLIIDHGGSEFSMIAHFRAHSMLVKSGDHVRQGQGLGKLGHSGDTDGPHCHYQLQAGPDWENADALPCQFNNVKEPFLDRGTYFEAK
jgi:hypothetical protein